MKHGTLLVLFVLAALACGSTFAEAPRGQDPAAEIAALRRDVTRLQAQVAALEEREARGEVAGVEMMDVVAYVNAQAQAAAALQLSLAESEEKGFTYGINPESREVMLAGFRQFLSTLQTDVPGTPPQAPPK